MKKSTAGFILLVVIGILGILGWKYLSGYLFDKEQSDTSDAKGDLSTIRVCGDNYLGYWFLISPEMRKLSAKKGIQIVYTDDGGIYKDRLKKFDNGDYDCIVLPVNSYLDHGEKYKYPGVIIAAISESKGADGIVGFEDKFPQGKINGLNDPSLDIVFTADSPSSFLLDLTIADFDLDLLRKENRWKTEVDGSGKVLEYAEKGKGDVFVLWEPDLSKALKLPGMKYIWGSDKFSGYIVDVIVFRRDYLRKNNENVMDFLTTYFRTLKIYSNNRDKMLSDMKKSTGQKEDVLKNILKKIEWFNLWENCQLEFDIQMNKGSKAKEGIINTIIACTDILIRSGRFKTDPLEGNPYKITNKSILTELSKNQIRSFGGKKGKKVDFSHLDDSAWARLEEIGTFRVEPITFQSWNNQLTEDGKEKLDKIAALLKSNYPGYRIIVRGHTPPGGDEKENKKLSLKRGSVVATYLIENCRIDINRIKAEGVGSDRPAKRKPNESTRAYNYRLSRVEFIAVSDNRL